MWVAGAEVWNNLAKQTGSGIANTITEYEFLKPIDKEGFDALWDFECNKIDNVQEKNRLLSQRDTVWCSSGGVPFYAKAIGSHLYIKNEYPTYDQFKPFFDEIFDGNLTISQRTILKQLATRPRRLEEKEEMKDLINRGLIYYDPKADTHNICIGMMRDYLKQMDIRIAQQMPYTHNLVDEICLLIENINNINELFDPINGCPIFKPVNQASSLFIDMKAVASDKTIMTSFALAVYRTYLERSEGLDSEGKKWKGYLLPEGFGKRYNFKDPNQGAFARAVDRLRQSYAHNKENARPKDNQMSELDMLDFFLGKRVLPTKPEEYRALQKAVLDKMKTELIRMKESLEKKYNK
ncbi:MAG: hypothetical protein IK075_09050 [Prevotella sp.]|nr:hypothetical protein [Prevotella sp.]